MWSPLCSNLVPVRSGSLIPDYGSLGLRHADAQLCTHLQATDLNLALKPGRCRLLASGTTGFHPKRDSFGAHLPFSFAR